MFQECFPVIDTQIAAEVLSVIEHSSPSITQHGKTMPQPASQTTFHSYYLCDYCPFMCLTEKDLADHVNMIHQIKKPSQMYEMLCPACPNTFNHKPSLESHLTYDHCLANSADRDKMVQMVLLAKKSTTYTKRDPVYIKPIEQIETTSIALDNVNNTSGNATTQQETILIFNEVDHAEKLLESVQVNALTDIRIVNDPVTNELKFIESIEEQPEEEVDGDDDMDTSNSQEEQVATSMNESIEIKFVVSTEGGDKESKNGITVANPNSLSTLTSDSKISNVNIDMNNTSIANPTVISKPLASGPFVPSMVRYMTEKKLYKCTNEQCRLKMQDTQKMQYHIKCHADGKFVCPECKESSPHWKTMSGHLWRMHNLDMELLKCDLCEYRTHSFSKLFNTHRLIHGDDKNFQCDKCSKMFKNAKQLRNHRDNSHKEPAASATVATFPCSECDRAFAKRRQLKVHMDTVHKKIKPFVCSFCGFTTSTKGALNMHVRLHTGEKPFTCEFCDYLTADHNSLRRHKLRHTGDKPYKCPHCDYECIQSSTYKMHIKTKHPGLDKKLLFSCRLCQFRSVNREVYSAHMHSQHPEFIANNPEPSTSAKLTNTINDSIKG